MPKESTTPPQLLRGMKDILPADQPYWWWVFDIIRRAAADYGFERIETPLLEATSLFVRSVGEGTDIVGKEMYSFVDKSGDSVTLKPEGTAGVVRAYIEHGMLNLPQPVKLWYLTPLFRHERPQAGRYRQHWQFGCEAIGVAQPIIDAQLVLLVRSVLQMLGLEFSIQINSIGDPQTRAQYAKSLQAFLKSKKSELTEEQKLTLQKNPMRLLDSKDPVIQAMLTDAPQIIDTLDDASRQHFTQVLEYLDDCEVPYTLNPKLIRGLDYYNRTVFEFWGVGDDSGAVSLGGGGRYDGLVESLGGRPTPAAGFGLGVDRIILQLKEKQIVPPADRQPIIYLAQLGEPARKKMLKLFDKLRAEGIRVAEGLTRDGLKQQLEVANRIGAHYTLIIGQKELMDDTIMIRDMENGIQEVVDFSKVVGEMKKRVDKAVANGTAPVTGQIKPERLERYSSPDDEEPMGDVPSAEEPSISE